MLKYREHDDSIGSAFLSCPVGVVDAQFLLTDVKHLDRNNGFCFQRVVLKLKTIRILLLLCFAVNIYHFHCAEYQVITL